MKLKVLGSSSRGNCYILENDSEALILEAGVKFAEVQRALNFNISKIAGCLISHEHGDHVGHINEFLNNVISVYASQGTIDNVKLTSRFIPISITSPRGFNVGNFKIIPFSIKHDAAEPLGFLIDHSEMGTLLFATDTYYLPNKFAGLSNILIECNYRMDILEENTRNGRVSTAQRNRTLQSHMSYETCLKTLQANDLRAVNNIVLIHLSDSNSNAGEFQQGIHDATGKTVHIAEKEMSLNFNKTPF